MKKLAYGLLAVACAGALTASVALTVGTRSAAGGGSRPPVSSEVRHMLRDVSSRNIEHSISTLAAFGTRHTLVADRPQPRHRRRDELGLRPVLPVRHWLERTVDRREANLHAAARAAKPEPGGRDERDRNAPR